MDFFVFHSLVLFLGSNEHTFCEVVFDLYAQNNLCVQERLRLLCKIAHLHLRLYEAVSTTDRPFVVIPRSMHGDPSSDHKLAIVRFPDGRLFYTDNECALPPGLQLAPSPEEAKPQRRFYHSALIHVHTQIEVMEHTSIVRCSSPGRPQTDIICR